MEGINPVRTTNRIPEQRISDNKTADTETVKSDAVSADTKTEVAAATAEQGGQAMVVRKDEYISSEKSGQKPTGLYSVKKEADGKTTIKYDDPRKAINSSGEASAGATVLNKLKGQRDKLKMQIKQEAGNDERVQSLKKKLAAIEKQMKQISE